MLSSHGLFPGLWMWSAPVERRGPDGGKYSLVLLDTEGIDAYDQVQHLIRMLGSGWEHSLNFFPPFPCPTFLTLAPALALTFLLPACFLFPSCPRLQTGQYSTQIFSLAVLLSSLFVFNQMGGIDEAALDRLSLVTGEWGVWQLSLALCGQN